METQGCPPNGSSASHNNIAYPTLVAPTGWDPLLPVKPPPFPLKWKLCEGRDSIQQGPKHLFTVGTWEVSDEQRLDFHGPLKISGEGGPTRVLDLPGRHTAESHGGPAQPLSSQAPVSRHRHSWQKLQRDGSAEQPDQSHG